jgi:serine/threonine-protein kinase
MNVTSTNAELWFSTEPEPPDPRLLVNPSGSTLVPRAESTDDDLAKQLFPTATPVDPRVEERIRSALLLVGYETEQRLDEQENSRVYIARRTATGEEVAVKVLLENPRDRSSLLRRFRQEARLMSSLTHPNLVKAIGYGAVSNVHYAILELASGVNLRKRVETQGPLPVSLAAWCAYQAADALEYMHQRGVVHRDVKPSNLVLSPDGRLKLLDLGLARGPQSADGSITLLFSDKLIGTPDYMAPEQVLDCHTVDARADLYALGCTLYFLLTGQPPFGGKNALARMIKHQTTEPKPVEEIRPETPEALAAICRKLMAKKPADRYETAAEAAAALARWAPASNEELATLAGRGVAAV